MPNSRGIADRTWAHARQCLIFYFSRRLGISNAEDLAHDTLAAVWSRDDYEFAHERDFLRVCYGFAANILKQGVRGPYGRFIYSHDLTARPLPAGEARGLKGAEINVFLEELRRKAETELPEGDWDLIEEAAFDDGPSSTAADPAEANRLRVRLHRARKKLARMTGWR